LWDEALGRIELTPGQVPPYERVDVELTDASERPVDGDYDRYAYLVHVFRELDYAQDRIRANTPFAVQPVLFNALLVQSDRDLASIAEVLGADPEPFRARAEQTAAALERKLWDDERSLYADYDVLARRWVPDRSPAGFPPLFAGVPGTDRAAQVAGRIEASLVDVPGIGRALPSLPLDDPRFRPTLYWRGPVWSILHWVVSGGLARYGYAPLSGELRRSMIELCRKGGFSEHYSPTTGRGHGGEQFAWTAGIVLDLLREEGSENAVTGGTEIK
jgi:neutral trehalase